MSSTKKEDATMLRTIKREEKETVRIAIAEARKMAKCTKEQYRAMIRDFKKEDEEMAGRTRKPVAALTPIRDLPRAKVSSLATCLGRKGDV